MSDSEILEILKSSAQFLDVRAPIEFAVGHIPGARNFPILDNEERKTVGTTYKQQGRDSAIRVGESLVDGGNRDRKIAQWQKFISQHEQSVLYCHRGGLRSMYASDWLEALGCRFRRLEGGYKRARHAYLKTLNEVDRNFQLIAITGKTGSGKSKLLEVAGEHRPILHLEAFANHRGSAFGKLGLQPSQGQFENRIAQRLLQIPAFDNEPALVLVEDESRMIGQCAVPESIFANYRSRPVILVEEPLANRVDLILADYVIDPYRLATDPNTVLTGLSEALLAIAKKLGQERYGHCLMLLRTAHSESLSGDFSRHRQWIELLLRDYYDPLYEKSFIKRNPQILQRGSREDLVESLKSRLSI